MEETQTQQAASNGNRSIMMLIVILLLAGAVVYLAMNRNSSQTTNNGTEITNEATSDESMTPSGAMEASDDAMTADEKKMAPSGTMENETEGEVKEFTVKGDEFTFAPNTMTVNKGDTVRITFENTEGFHDLVIDEFDVATAQIQAGASETVEFVADKTGSFEYYCSVGQHRQMGMVGTLTVK
ncbi:MAG: plastocyanin/azurin family copper-binding protein [Weeksellaceae bacterium]